MNAKHIKHQNYCDDFRVQYDACIPDIDTITATDVLKDEYSLKADQFLNEYNETLDEIESLTNSADGWDYALSITSGLIAGIIDSVIVGKWNFYCAKALSNKEINQFVIAFAKEKGMLDHPKFKNKDTGRLETAVEFLEEKFPLPGDSTYRNKTGIKISAKSHHLDDISHHPTIVGLLFSIITQFKAVAVYYNREGERQPFPMIIDENGMLEGKTPSSKISAGIINWCIDVAKNRRGHLVSDMAGSTSSAKKLTRLRDSAGASIPGTLLATLKELSVLPGVSDTDFSEKLYKAFVNGIGEKDSQVNLGAFNELFKGADSKFDVRTEKAVKHEFSRQSLPVVINEIVVRSFYFIRHLTMELREKADIRKINWKKVIPLKNKTIVRMITISSGVFTVADMIDAGVRAVVDAKGVNPATLPCFVLRVNFVGIGRFSLACSSDLLMGIKKYNYERAIVSGDIARNAIEMVEEIKSLDDMNRITNENLDELCKQTTDMASYKF